jgi:hypothetical protein
MKEEKELESISLGNSGYNANGTLEKITLNGINSKHKVVKTAFYIPAFYIGGMLFGRGHETFAEKLNMTPSQFTKRHATIVGLIGITIESLGLYLLGQEAKEGLPGKMANLFNVSYNAAVFAYWSVFGIAQNLGRIRYANKTGKGIGSIGLVPAITNLIYYTPNLYRKIKKLAKS